MSGLEAILYREAKIRFTNFAWLFWDLFYPLGYLLVFGVGITHALGSPFPELDVNYNDFFLAGVLAMASFGIASNTAWGFFVDRDNGIFYEMLTYPMSRAQFLLGKVSFNIFLALLQAGITVLLAAVLLGVKLRLELLPVLLVGVIVGTAGWFFFFAIFALRIRRNDIFNSVISLFYFLFLFASSMFYPLAPLPGWFRTAALANPITWQVDLLRYSSIGLGTGHLVAESIAFLIFTLFAFGFGVRALHRPS
ncbi:MAG: ABC transporter permease [Acidobacteria bacterium]|nr:ABC transporter permease [Acidobacteriota bacterium]